MTFFDKHASKLEAARGRPARRPAAGALAVQPVPQRPGRDRAPQRRAREDVRERLHHAAPSSTRRPAKDLGLKQGLRYVQRREPYFFDYVQEKLIERYGVGVVRAGGLRIHTTIDPKLQDFAREAINSYYGDPAGPSSAIVSIDPAQRQDQGDGLERHLRRAQLQPRRPGPPPARLGLQDDGADRRDPQGRRPRLHLLHLQAAQHRRPRVRALGGQDLRRQLRRHDEPDAGHARVRQHRLRAADPRRRPEGGLQDGEAARHHDQARLLPGRGTRRPHARRHHARDGHRLRHPGQRRHATPADRDRAGGVPRRQEREPRRAPRASA